MRSQRFSELAGIASTACCAMRRSSWLTTFRTRRTSTTTTSASSRAQYLDGDGESRTYTKTLVTGRGLSYIHKRLFSKEMAV